MIFITHLDDNNFKEIISNGIILVDIFADWCQPCKQLSPIIDQISTDYQGRVIVGKLDADASRETAMDIGIRNIPTVILYKDGVAVDRLAGLVSKAKLSEMIDKHL